MSERPRSVMQLISTDGVYGAERVVLDLAAYFSRQSWESRVVAIDCPGADALLALAERAGLKTHKLRAQNRPIWGSLHDLRSYILDEKIDVVHAHGYKADTLLRWCGVRGRTRLVSTCHTWYSDTLRMKFYEYLDKCSLRSFDKVAVVSPQLRTEVLAAGISADRIVMIPNGTSFSVPEPATRARIRRELSFADTDFVMVRVGRLAASKGNDILLRAFASAHLPVSARLLIVGDGEERGLLEALTASLGLSSRVSFAGYRADIHDLLVASDLFVLPSVKEGLPIALLEAMAARLPVVSTDAGAIPLALEGGRNSWVVPSGQVAALRDALADAVARPETRMRYSEVAYEDFVGKFSADAMGSAYGRLYEPVDVAVRATKNRDLSVPGTGGGG